MSKCEVIHRGRVSDEPFSNYLYEIRHGDRRVAEPQHDYRGGEHSIRFESLDAWEPFDNIIEGGGPEPLRVSIAGASLLKRRLSQK